MAKNWNVTEAVTEIKKGNKVAIADIGKRFPLTTAILVALVAKAKEELEQLSAALPETTTMGKIEKRLKDGVDQVEEMDEELDDIEEDAEVEEKPKAKKGEEKKEVAKKSEKKTKGNSTVGDLDFSDVPEAKRPTITEISKEELDGQNGNQLYYIGRKLGLSGDDLKGGKSKLIENILEAYEGGEVKVTNPKSEKKSDKKGGKKEEPKKATKKAEVEEDEFDDDDDVDYSEMEPKELYKLCKERGIEVEKKKPSKYYIQKLEEADAETDEDEEEEWEEEPKDKKSRKKSKKEDEDEWTI